VDNSIESELLPASVGLGGRASDGTERTGPDPGPGRARIPLLELVRDHAEVTGLLQMADEFLAGQGFTEHGFRHANLVGHIAYNVLTYLGHDEHLAELAAVAGYLHDIGNVVSRSQHGQSSGLIAFTILRELDVPIADIAAVIVADKSDVHRSRVRESGDIETDIHDRVNFAVTSSFLRVCDRTDPDSLDSDAGVQAEVDEVMKEKGVRPAKSLVAPVQDVPAKTLTLELEVDTTVTPVFEYFEIFMDRMVMCRRAGRTLGAEFKITVNDVPVL
jgi:hypothetical protein